MINYRYRIVEELGKGGGGEIFLVYDVLDNRRLAMKLLSGDATTRIDAHLFRKEFSLLSSLSHTNLIQVFDFATVLHSERQGFIGRHFYTMEYVEGKDALTYFADMPRGRTKTQLLETALIQTLGALDHIHREGIIHFDIKPQNLLVVEGSTQNDLRIKLTDFGLSETKIEGIDAPVRGTLEYTAPEVVQGLAIDNRLDLYSLGVTFYHLWEGHCPFEASDAVELLKKVLNEDLPSVRRLPEYASLLPDLIEVLCKKKPEERYRSARDAMMIFSSSKYEDTVKLCLYLERQSKVIGRRKEIEFIESIIEGAQGQEPFSRMIVVSGVEGIGKSACLNEVARCQREKGVLVLESKEKHPQAPFDMVARFVRQLNMELRSRGCSPEPVGCLATGVSTGGVSGDKTSEATWSPGAAVSVDKQAEVYTQYLQEASRFLPLSLIVDDIDRVDTESLGVIMRIIANSNGSTVIIVASVHDRRNGHISFAAGNTTQLFLPELTADDTTHLMNFRLGQPLASGGTVPRFHELFGGNPAVILEASRLIANALPLAVLNERKAIAEMSGQLEDFLSINLEKFFAHRFEELCSEERRIVEWLSCFDEPCPVELLNGLVALESEAFEGYIQSLEKREYISCSTRPSEQSNDRTDEEKQCRNYSIRQLKLKSYVYNEVLGDHAEQHRSIATGLENISGRDESTYLKELARQWELCGEKQKAMKFFEAAGERANNSESFPEAAEMFRRALACLPENQEESKIPLKTRLAQAYFSSGSYRESAEKWEEILACLPQDDARQLTAHKSAGKAFSRVGGNAKSLQHFETALSKAADDLDRFEIQQEIIALKIAEGQYDEAVELSLRQKELAGRQPDKQLLATVETDLGIAQFYKGNFPESLKSFSATYVIYEKCQNRGKTIDALNNIGNVLSVMRDFRGAIEKWKQALELIVDQGPQHQRAQIFNNMGIAHYKLREFEEARSYYEEAKNIFDLLGSDNGIAFTLTNLGEVVYAEGNYERALRLWTEVLELYREMQDTGSMAQTYLQLAQVHFVLGDMENTARLVREAEQLIRKYNLSTLEALLNYLKGSCFAASGRHEEAADAFRAAERGFQVEGSFTGGTESEREKYLLTLLRLAEITCLVYDSAEVARILEKIQAIDWKALSPLVRAEMNLSLGLLSRHNPTLFTERPLMYFRTGCFSVAEEQVSEISWKISYEMGREYMQRGNRDKARENFLNVKVVIEYFASKFTDERLRDQYLAANRRSECLAAAQQYQ